LLYISFPVQLKRVILLVSRNRIILRPKKASVLYRVADRARRIRFTLKFTFFLAWQLAIATNRSIDARSTNAACSCRESETIRSWRLAWFSAAMLKKISLATASARLAGLLFLGGFRFQRPSAQAGAPGANLNPPFVHQTSVQLLQLYSQDHASFLLLLFI
jgi:hypothetical protein